LEEIIVTASLRPATIGEFPVSTTVLDASVIDAAGVQHFADVLGLVPNLNWSGGTSRPRYFQLRGVGELEQYQGAPNPSVGFLVDEIDFSGIGMVATLFDVDQVEVLRGLPSFVLLAVRAPLAVRFQRALARGRPGDPRTLEEFRARERQENAADPWSQQLDATFRRIQPLFYRPVGEQAQH